MQVPKSEYAGPYPGVGVRGARAPFFWGKVQKIIILPILLLYFFRKGQHLPCENFLNLGVLPKQTGPMHLHLLQ